MSLSVKSLTNKEKDNLYFVRLSDNKDYFIHPNGEEYIANKGESGACIFTKEMGKKFIESVFYDNLELVKVSDILNKNKPLG